MWAGLPDKARNWRWFYSTTLGQSFSVAVILGILGSIVTWRRTPKISKLQGRIAELENNLAQQQSGYFELLTNQLSVLATLIGFGDTERISVYRHNGRSFEMLGRYSLNPEYQKPGRVIYPDNEGCIGEAWSSTRGLRAFVDDLPNPTTSLGQYQARLTSEWGVPEDTVQGMRMKSRTYAAFPIFDSRRTKKVAVIVFESVKRKVFNYTTLQNTLNEGEERRISNFLESMKSQEPTLSYASKQGY